MKRSFLVFLVVLLCLCFSACKEKDVYLSDGSAPDLTSSQGENTKNSSEYTPSGDQTYGSVSTDDSSAVQSGGEQSTPVIPVVSSKTETSSQTVSEVTPVSSDTFSATESADAQTTSSETPADSSMNTTDESSSQTEESSSEVPVSSYTVGNIVPIK